MPGAGRLAELPGLYGHAGQVADVTSESIRDTGCLPAPPRTSRALVILAIFQPGPAQCLSASAGQRQVSLTCAR